MDYNRQDSGCGCFFVVVVMFVAMIILAVVYLPAGKEDGLTAENLKETLMGEFELDTESLSEGFGDILGSFAGEGKDNQEIDENTIEETRYYFSRLNEEEKKAYGEISKGLRDMKTTIMVSATDFDQVSHLMGLVIYDHPEYFWCEGEWRSYQYENSVRGTSGAMMVVPVYNCSQSEMERRQAEIDAAVSACLAGISMEASDYDKVRYVYEYIIQHTDYDLNSSDNQNIYSVFGNGVSVCAGYSKATQYLLQKLGVECIYVTGTGNGEAHAWNIVKCDGVYSHVDTTYGDPFFIGADGSTSQNGIRYDYLCCSDETIFQTHALDGEYEVPRCD